ncbi:MAG TPA: dephospho-CoA kinase [Nannocystis exedens]|nr:dephospho-CoA kinase [Nannocystis exedens]
MTIMEVYGLTGGIGSGKSTVASVIEEYGIPVVSADELSRMVVMPGSKGLEEVVCAFGEEVLTDNGHLDRAKLAKIVFTDEEKRLTLERILHPRIRSRFEEVLDALEKAGQRLVIYEVPLLFENNIQENLDGVIVVCARDDLRIARVSDRDGFSADETRARMAAQMDDSTRQSLANYVLTNNGDRMDLRREVELLLVNYLKLNLPYRRTPPPAVPKVASGIIDD